MTEGRGFSFPYGVPIIVYPLLLLATTRGVGAWWGYLAQVVYLGLVGLFAWEGLSRKQYEQIHAKEASLNRLTWMLNWLIFFVLLPLAAWLVVGLPALLRGVR